MQGKRNGSSSKAPAKAIPGIQVRHARSCPANQGGACGCQPTYRAWVFDPHLVCKNGTIGGKRYEKFSGPGALSAARGWRRDAMPLVARREFRSTNLTVRDAWEEWIEKAEKGELLSRFRRPYSPSALRGYRADMERFVLPPFGAVKLSDLTGDDLQRLIERMTGDGYGGQSVRNAIVPLQALYRRFRRQVQTDPTDGLDLPEPGRRRERAAAPAEAAALLEPLPDDVRPAYATAFYCGLRRGELRALRVADVHGLDGDGVTSLHVSHSWDDVTGEKGTKSLAGVRDIPVPATLRTILAEHVERTGRSGSDFLFGASASRPFAQSHLRRKATGAWAAAAVGRFLRGESSAIELEPIKLHEARHSYSTFLDAAGISEARADRYMGHSNPSVSARYRHQLPGQLAEDAERLEAYLNGASEGKVVALVAVEAPHEARPVGAADRPTG
jgi:integrase